MPNTVAQHAVATFTSPVNGTSPIDANTVRGNDNTIRTSYNSHDADPGVHLQSSTLASRPVAGTAGRKWMTADTSSYRVWYDDGTTWQEVTYLSGGGGTISGSLLITGTLGVTGLITATGGVSGNVTGNLTGNASTATALATARNINGVSFNGTADITVTAAAGTLTGSTLASGVTASSLTSVGTLSSLTVSGNTILGAEVFRGSDDSFMRLAGGNPSATGANVIVFGSTHATSPGRVSVSAVGTGQIELGTGGIIRAVIAANGNLAVDTNTLFVDAANDRVGIQTATPAYPLQVRRAGGAGSLGVSVDNAVSQRTVQYFAIGDNTSDTTAHAWYTRAGTATDVLRLALDYPGNLGLGVTPSGSSATTLQFPDGVTVSNAGTAASFGHNAVFNSGWKYVGTGTATLYQKYLGTHAWFTAPSGTAGNAISFVQIWSMSASGHFLAGTDNSYDIGASGATRPRTVYVGTSAVINDITVGRGAGAETNSTSIGSLALNANTTGGGNTAIGKSALRTNTTGNANTSIGNSALFANTTGNANTAVGADVPGSLAESALSTNTTGVRNVAVGNSSLGKNTTGGYNTALGVAALYNNTTADQNVAVGNDAGDVITTGVRNTILGQGSDPSANNGNDQTVVGQGLTGKGNDTAFIGGTNGAYNEKNVTTWETTSDARLKTDIVDLDADSLALVQAVRLRTFRYRTADEITDLPSSAAIATTGTQIGVIAQELQAVIPSCVTENSTGVLSVSTDPLLWHLMAAVQTLSTRLAALEA